MRFHFIYFALFTILFSFSACVSDGPGSEGKNNTITKTNPVQVEKAADPVISAKENQPITSASSKVKPLPEKAKPAVTKRDGTRVDPEAKQKVIDNAKKQLAELEANKSSIAASDYSRKKASIEDMMDNPEKFVSKKRLTPKERSALPNACDLLSDNFIAKTIGIDAASITLKDGTNSASQYAKACFFRWDYKGVPNSGVLIQVQENPLPEEIDDWAAYYIQAKINQGETNPNTMESTKFKPYKDLGVTGAYNYEMHRYLWRTEDDIVFMIALNLRGSESEEMAWVKTLGKEAMKNYKS